MQLNSTVNLRYVEMQTDEEELAWRNGLAVLMDVLARYHNSLPSDQAPIAIELPANSLNQPALAG